MTDDIDAPRGCDMAAMLATVAALQARLAEARALLRRCRTLIAAIRDIYAEDGRPGVGDAILREIDAALRGGEVARGE